MSSHALRRPLDPRYPGANEGLVYIGAGPLLAIVLGFALIPFRGSTNAANLSFPFVVLTIVVSALGGRGAAVMTALVSALSMDFFLTRPYLSLRIYENHDVVAFVGLAVCGLVAASLGSPQRIASLHELRGHAGLVQQALAELETAGPLEATAGGVLERARQILPVRALVLRDAGGRVVSAAPHRAGLEALPTSVVGAETLLPREKDAAVLRSAPPLPADGARLALVTHQRQQGWLDLWGDGSPATAASRRALTGLARILAVMLGRESRH